MLSFEDLHEEYAPEVYRFALWLAGDTFEAEDITSETFVRAWSRFDHIRTETLKAYRFTIARNIYLQHRRKGRRQVVLDDAHPDPAPGPAELVESRLEILRVQRLLQTVTEPDRAAFILRFQHELPYEEIARTIGVSVVAARVKVHRVRKKLVTALLDGEDR